jgi:hypothetical protein
VTRRPLLGLFVLVAAVALVAAGCGSKKKGPYQSSKADYAAALNSVCAAGNAKQKAITITSLKDLATKGPQEVAIFNAEIASVKALGTPPDEIKTQVADALAQAAKLPPLYAKLIADAKAGDQAAAQAVGTQIAAVNKATDPDFTAIGATACLSTAS